MHGLFATFNVSMWWGCDGKGCFCGGVLVELNTPPGDPHTHGEMFQLSSNRRVWCPRSGNGQPPHTEGSSNMPGATAIPDACYYNSASAQGTSYTYMTTQTEAHSSTCCTLLQINSACTPLRHWWIMDGETRFAAWWSGFWMARTCMYVYAHVPASQDFLQYSSTRSPNLKAALFSCWERGPLHCICPVAASFRHELIR